MVDETLPPESASAPVPAAANTPTTTPVSPLPRAPRSLRSKLMRWALRTALGVVLVVVAVLLFVINAGRSEAGTAAVLAKVPGLTITGLRGSLWGDALKAEQLRWQSSNGATVVSIDGLAWTGLQLRPLPQVGQWLGLSLATLHADTLRLALPPSDPATPTVAPADLALPLALNIHALSVGRIYANALGDAPLRDLQAQVQLGADFGHTHRFDAVQIGWDRLKLGGQLHVTADAPMALQAQLNATQDASAPAPASASASAPITPPAPAEWQAQAQVSGTLNEPQVQASVRGRLGATQREQTLDVQATLRPFEPWPLARLSAQAQRFDLAALSSAAPTTALSGQARAITTGRDQPVTVELDLRNELPGRWDQQRLPITQLQGAVRGLPQAPSTVTLSGLKLQLGNGSQSAGQLTGVGEWTAQRWTLNLQLSDVQPLLLDQRASAMRVGGPVQLAGTGMGTTAVSSKGTGATASPMQIDVRADLRGQLQQAGTPPVRLQLDASVTPLKLDLRELRAEAGAAQARLTGTAQRTDASGTSNSTSNSNSNNSPWRVLAQGQLSEFDPLPWWPGPAGSPWRQGPHRLNGALKADLTVPVATAGSSDLSAAQGQAELQLSRSLMAGVAVEGTLDVRSAAADTSGPAGLQAQLTLNAAGNRLSASGRLAGHSSQAAAERWSAEIDAPQLASLAPWAAMFSAAPRGPAPALAGSLQGSAQLQGRWPAVRSSGNLSADTLRWQGSTAQQLQASWQAGSSSDDAINLQLSSGPLRQGNAGLESAQLAITGTLRQHRISGTVESTALPPAWTELLLAAPPVAAGTTRHSVAQLDAHGELLSHATRGPSGWHGVLDAFTLRSHGPTATPLLRTQAQALSLDWLDTPLRLQLQPGRAELLGTAVRWKNVMWQAAGPLGQAPQLDLDGELETLAVAPLLARLQPDFGWGGDLQVGAQIKLRSTPQVTADIVFERLRGDLSVTDDAGVQALGLTDLRLALNAQDHVWSFTQALAGKTVGVAAGAVITRTTPDAPWPGPQSPLSGVFEAQVANLGTWGAWVPTGWRLGGALRTSATLSGRLGAPEYTGEMRGNQLSVRNVLQGVNVSEGEVAIALQGASARIDTFTAKAGAGTLKLEGDASLGETPRADLRLTADKVALLGRVDRRIVTSGNARLLLDATTLGLTGAFKIDEGLIDFSRGDAPSLADDVVVVRAAKVPERGAAVPVAATTEAAPVLPTRQRNVTVDLQVDLGERLRLLGRGLNTGLRGALHLTTPGGRMAINGSVSTTDGTYAAYGQNLSIDRGTITFNGPVENPRLDIEATRPNLDVRVGVIVSGTAQSPRVRLFSDPELADLEKLSWLVMGRASDGLGRADTALLQTAAVALLSGEGDGVTTQFTKAIGLDELSLRQNDTGDVRETVVTLGKQLSRRWYVGYERGLNATTGTWQLIYRIAQRFTLRAQSGLDNSLDVIWTWRWK
ncbi:MAG: hypothetical protein RJA98_2674 [Pseudomonadota bacterium]